MRIAFYAPLKAPDHPVPSGERRMAQLLVRALRTAGHRVELASRLRARIVDPGDAAALEALHAAAAGEVERLARQWRAVGPPQLWFCYHPYYKAPDLLGPTLAERFGFTCVTAEASYAAKRDAGPWAPLQAQALRVVRTAALNLYFTERDRQGLAALVEARRLAELAPFIEPPAAPGRPPKPDGGTPALIAVAMMRAGRKLDSYRTLAAALARLGERRWRLTIVGDGPERARVEAAFAGFAPGRIRWCGELPPQRVAAELAGADLYAWPGHGEAYGLAYLEAQAAGLPVVALRTAGVPAVVRDGETGLLAADDGGRAYAAALARLLDEPGLRLRLGVAAQRFVHTERSLAAAAERLGVLLASVISGE